MTEKTGPDVERLITALERLVTEGPPVRRYWVQFESGFSSGRKHYQTVVEAHSGTDAILAARVRCGVLEGRRSIDTAVTCIRPVLDSDCLACGVTDKQEDGVCRGCGRRRADQILMMKGAPR